MLHRSMLVHCNPHLKIIDGITITEDEKVKARLLHAESPQQVLSLTTTAAAIVRAVATDSFFSVSTITYEPLHLA